MLNFTGQTKRRNVNLGNKSNKSKEEILLSARKEREKRSLEKKRTESAQIIQSHIRRYHSNKVLIFELISNMTYDQAGSIFIAYSIPIFHNFGASVIRNLLNVLSNDRPLINVKLFGLIKAVSAYKSNAELVDSLLDKVSTKYPVSDVFVDSISTLIRKAPFAILDKSFTRICDLITCFGIDKTNLITQLFALSRHSATNPDNVSRLMVFLGSAFYPTSLFHGLDITAVVENLSQIYSHADSSRKAVFGNLILSGLSQLPANVLVQSASFKALYSREFINFMSDSRSDRAYEYISAFVYHSPDDYCKNNVLIALIAKPDFMKNLHSKILGNTCVSLASVSDAILPCILLLVDLLDIYLSVSSDFELLNNRGTYPIEYFIQSTNFLKSAVFDIFWNEDDYNSDVSNAFLKIVRKIYLRDSRLHFCSTKKNKDYWSVSDAEFLQVNISKYIEEYENFYREHSKITSSDDSDVDAVVEQSDAMIRSQFIESMKSSLTNSTPTRQLRKLEILSSAPFFIPFQQRVEWFYMLISLDRKRLKLDGNDPMNMFIPWNMNHNSSRQQATISRENPLDDAFEAFNPIGESFKAKLSVTFVNEFGPEAGIDGGGITKEFLTSVSDEGFKDGKYGLFKQNEKHEIYPSSKIDSSKHLNYLWFMGKVLGKCLYEHVLIDVSFTDFFLKKLLNSQNNFSSSFDDLASLDSTLYSNLVKLLGMSAAELEALDLHFEVTDDDTLLDVNLIPNGSHTVVTKNNALQYVLSVADYKLNRKLKKATRYFCGGLSMMIPFHWIGMFNSVELQMLISGGGKDIDFKDLRSNTEYGDYTERDETIINFWQILEECTSDQRLKFVKFVTSVPRAPLQGFGSLVPRFGIRNAGNDVARLPTSSTCVNLLKLPDYRDKELLRQKLLYAINAEARFDLS